MAVTEWGQRLSSRERIINDNNVKDYRRELDIQTGIAATEFSCKDVTYKREHFVSNPDQVMVTELSASEKGKLDLNVKMELNNSGLEGKTTFDEKNQTCTIEGKVKDNDLKFCTTMKLVLTGGKLSADEKNQVYQIQDADCVMIVMAAETDYKNDYPTYRDKNKDLKKVVAVWIWENSAHQYRRTSLWMNIEMEIIRIIWKCWHFNMDVI